MKIWVLTISLGLMASHVWADDVTPVAPPAACVAVTAPPPLVTSPLPPKPVLPACVNEKTHISTCRHGEIDKYNDAVNAHNDAMQKVVDANNVYITALNTYMAGVNAYNNCEIHRINDAYKDIRQGG